MATHNDLTPEMIEYIQARMERMLASECGLAPGRLQIRLFDPAMHGKTGMEIAATPPLTEKEDARVQAAVVAWNRAAGGSPIIKEAKC